MAFRKLIQRRGLFSPGADSPLENPSEPQSESHDTRENPVSPVRTSAVSAPNKLRPVANRDWLANIRRIKSSEYYNGINDIVATLELINKSENSAEALTSLEEDVLDDLEAMLACVAPRWAEKAFEFRQLSLSSKSKLQPASEIISDYFALYFCDESQANDARVDFFVTRNPNVVIVETEKDLANARLFQSRYADAAKAFGFMRVIWVDPGKQVEVARSDHPEWTSSDVSEIGARMA